MTRALLFALALVATPLAAQESAVIGGWALPEGAVVRTESVNASSVQAGASVIKSRIEESAVTTIDSVADGQFVRARQTLEREDRRSLRDGRPMPSSPDPLLGLSVVMERTATGWTQRANGWRPNAAQRDEMGPMGTMEDVEYPERPLAVGETIVVPDSALRQLYDGATDGPHRLTVRLDSLGTVGGAPVAYLTQEVEVAIEDDEGFGMTMDMRASIVRRLDWMLDVETLWSGDITYSFPGGGSVPGTMTMRMTQTATLPE